VASTMNTNNYQWGYESIYEEDVISAAAAQLAAWKERLDMNAQLRNEEDALSAAVAQLAAWKERLEMNVIQILRCLLLNHHSISHHSTTVRKKLPRYVPPEPNSSYQEIIIATTNDIGVERIIKEVRFTEQTMGTS
ncbi:hypothetical protein ACLOJK_018818, partial [Asimina triloba]